jgi:hypothetical protein
MRQPRHDVNNRNYMPGVGGDDGGGDDNYKLKGHLGPLVDFG